MTIRIKTSQYKIKKTVLIDSFGSLVLFNGKQLYPSDIKELDLKNKNSELVIIYFDDDGLKNKPLEFVKFLKDLEIIDEEIQI